MNGDLTFWVQLAGGLAVPSAVAVVCTRLVTAGLPAARWRRWCWQVVLLATLFGWCGELTGVAGWVRQQSAAWGGSRMGAWAVRVIPLPEERLSDLWTGRPGERDGADGGIPGRPGESGEPVVWPAGLWATGTMAWLAWIAAGHLRWRAWRGAGRTSAATDTDLRERLIRLGSELGFDARQVILFVHPRGPCAGGLVRPWMAVPATLADGLGAREQDAILAHELAHLAARDSVWRFLADLACAVAWWHPLVWYARRQLQRDMELSADLASSRVPGGREALAEALLVMGRRLVGAVPPVRGLGIAGAGLNSDLARRVRALLTASPADDWQPAAGGVQGAAAIVAIMGATGWMALGNPLPRSDVPSAGGVPVSGAEARVASGLTDRGAQIRSDAGGEGEATARWGARESDVASEEGRSRDAGEDSVVSLEVKVLWVTDRGTADTGIDWVFGDESRDEPAPSVGPSSDDLPGASTVYRENVRVERHRVQGQSARLSEAQLRALLRRLEDRGGVELVAVPRVTTRSGRGARMSIEDVRTLVVGVEVEEGTETEAGRANYVTEPARFGTTMDVLPVLTNGLWRIEVVGRVTEFLGYDDPGDFISFSSGGAEPIHVRKPLPRLRVLETAAAAALQPGEALVLRGPIAGQPPVWKGGWDGTRRTESDRRRLFVVVTPRTEP